MKTFLIIIVMFGLVSFTGTGSTTNTDELLNDQQTRTEIFNTIQNNHEFMTEFMQQLEGNPQAMMTWQGNTQFMNQKYMLNLMQNHPEVMQQLMNNIISLSAKDSTWTNDMINQMVQYPQMWQIMGSYMSGMMGTNGSQYGYGMQHMYSGNQGNPMHR